MNENQLPKQVLPLIILAQFAGTSLWFAGNAIIGDLTNTFDLGSGALGTLTAVVQFGFITGTLLFAMLTIADRFSPVLVFLVCAILGGLSNLSIVFFTNNYLSILILRFFTGFFLAGIYPVGMKISSDWYGKGLGKALGYLVGALVLGTAFPHLLKGIEWGGGWQQVLIFVSIFAMLGGGLLYMFVGDGPNRHKGTPFKWDAIPYIFKEKAFRSAAFGYFGHMWELYTFWAFIPVLLQQYPGSYFSPALVSIWCFAIIGIGSLGCILGGYWSLKVGSAKVALWMLIISGSLCLLAPLLMHLPLVLLLVLLLVWGFAVVGDSPQFSTIVAKTAPKAYVGTALTIVNSIGFALTIVSIQVFSLLMLQFPVEWVYWLLIPGPVFGIISIRFNLRQSELF